jgi:hypothetical protein
LTGLEDTPYSQAEQIAYLAQSYDTEKSSADTEQAAINQIMQDKLTEDDFKKWGSGEEIDWKKYDEVFTEAEIEPLKEHFDGLQESAKNLVSLQQ